MIKPEEESGPSDEKAWGGGHWEPDSRSDLTVEKMRSQRFTSKGAGGGRVWGMGGARPGHHQDGDVHSDLLQAMFCGHFIPES